MYRMGIRVGGADLDHHLYTFIAAIDEAIKQLSFICKKKEGNSGSWR